MEVSKVRKRPGRFFRGDLLSLSSSYLVAVAALLTITANNYDVALASEDTAPTPLQKYQTPWTYSTNEEIGAFAQRMGREYPEYCNAYTIGESVMGNKLWVLTVSKEAPQFSSPDYTPSSLSPSFLYIGNMHGNEPLGRQLMVYLAEELCSMAGKGKDLIVDRIVGSGSVHLLFSLNPDGFALHTRDNANKVDLNRNFPDPILRNGDLNLTGKEEPETLVFMKYVERMGDSLVGMTTLHEGADIMVLPWDGNRHIRTGQREFNPAPDYKMLYHLGKRYADLQPKFINNPEFPQAPEGVLNGADWYPLWGGIQDWTYIVHQIYGTTIEMNHQKWPAESELETLWIQHRPSMYALMVAYVCEGLTVEVDFAPGLPEEEEVVVTMLTPEMGRPVTFKSSTLHAVHYPVPEGEYSVRVDWASGESATHSVNVSPGVRASLRIGKTFDPAIQKDKADPVDVNANVPAVVEDVSRAEPQAAPRSSVHIVHSNQSTGAASGAGLVNGNTVVKVNDHHGVWASDQKDGGQKNPKPVMFIYIRNFSILVTLLLVLFINIRRRRRAGGTAYRSSSSWAKAGPQMV